MKSLNTLIKLAEFIRVNYENVADVELEEDAYGSEAVTFTSNGVYHSLRPDLAHNGDLLNVFEITEKTIQIRKVR